jgi:hypothetical protein
VPETSRKCTSLRCGLINSSRRNHLWGSNDTAVDVGGLVGSSADDGVRVSTRVETSVESVLGAPAAGVEGAVGTERNIVLEEDVGCVEVAGVVFAVGIGEVLTVEYSLSLTSGGAEGGVVGVVVEQPHAVVGVLAGVGVEGSVDSSDKVSGGVEFGDRRGGLAASARNIELRVTVGTSDDNVESLTVGILRTTPLAIVGSSLGANGVTVDGALEVGLRRGVGTAVLGLVHGVTLVEDVETEAVLLGVTEVGTGLDIVVETVDVLVGEVTNLLGATGSINKGLLVALRGGSSPGSLPQVVVEVGVSSDAAVTGNVTDTTRLLVTADRLTPAELSLNTLILDNGSNGGCGSCRVVRDGSSLSLLDLGAKDSGGGNSQSSLDVDHLGSGGDKAADSGGSDSVTHLDGWLERLTEG